MALCKLEKLMPCKFNVAVAGCANCGTGELDIGDIDADCVCDDCGCCDTLFEFVLGDTNCGDNVLTDSMILFPLLFKRSMSNDVLCPLLTLLPLSLIIEAVGDVATYELNARPTALVLKLVDEALDAFESLPGDGASGRYDD